MITFDAEAWSRVSRHLDTVLELDAGARRDYIAHIEAAQPEEAAALGAILASRTEPGFDDFLAVPPTPVAELAATSSFVGARLGPYVTEVEIGRGGMGSVWRARRAD